MPLNANLMELWDFLGQQSLALGTESLPRSFGLFAGATCKRELAHAHVCCKYAVMIRVYIHECRYKRLCIDIYMCVCVYWRYTYSYTCTQTYTRRSKSSLSVELVTFSSHMGAAALISTRSPRCGEIN